MTFYAILRRYSWQFGIIVIYFINILNEINYLLLLRPHLPLTLHLTQLPKNSDLKKSFAEIPTIWLPISSLRNSPRFIHSFCYPFYHHFSLNLLLKFFFFSLLAFHWTQDELPCTFLSTRDICFSISQLQLGKVIWDLKGVTSSLQLLSYKLLQYFQLDFWSELSSVCLSSIRGKLIRVSWEAS